MNSESMNYIRNLVEEAYYRGALAVFEELTNHESGFLPYRPPFKLAAREDAKIYAQSLELNEKALRCANSEEPKREGTPSKNTQREATTLLQATQVTPLAAELSGLAVSIGVLAGKVNAEEWEFLKVLRSNIQSAADQAAELENNLEIPNAGRKELA